MIKRIIAAIFSFFRKKAPQSAPPIPQQAARAPRKIRQSNEYETYATLRGLLSNLEDHFAALKVLKKYDIEMYQQYKRFGGIVSPESAVIPHQTDNLSMPELLPSFAALSFSNIDDDEGLFPRIVCFQRIKFPRNCQPSNGIIYNVVFVYFDDKIKKPAAFDYYVSVKDGRVTTLKTFGSRTQKIKTQTIIHTEWAYNRVLTRWAKTIGTSPAQAGAMAFASVMNAAQSHGLGLQVMAERHGVVARFSVDLLRTPYFFKHRDAEDNGKRKRIFHIVRTHKRTANGKTSFVRSHFRGNRKFTWAGCNVELVMQGTHSAITALDAGIDAVEADDPSVTSIKTLTSADFASHLDDLSRGGRAAR